MAISPGLIFGILQYSNQKGNNGMMHFKPILFGGRGNSVLRSHSLQAFTFYIDADLVKTFCENFSLPILESYTIPKKLATSKCEKSEYLG